MVNTRPLVELILRLVKAEVNLRNIPTKVEDPIHSKQYMKEHQLLKEGHSLTIQRV